MDSKDNHLVVPEPVINEEASSPLGNFLQRRKVANRQKHHTKDVKKFLRPFNMDENEGESSPMDTLLRGRKKIKSSSEASTVYKTSL